MVSENVFLLYSFGMGIFITFVYDFLHIARNVCTHSTFAVSLEDLAFWIACFFAVFYLMHTQSDGTLRWFSVLGAFAGMLLYKKTLSGPFIKAGSFLLEHLLRPVRFLKRKIDTAGAYALRGGGRAQRLIKKKLTHFKKMLKLVVTRH